jgi:squalene-hopene/tetraprenyl-beta-curcumene cyclase
MSSKMSSHEPMTKRAMMTLQRAVMALRHQQHADGHWCAVLEGDSILESEYLLMKFILGQEQEPMADGRGPEVLDRIAAGLRRQQRADGSWGQYPGSGIDVSATVKAYFALKLMGDALEAPHMCRAREQVLAHGGAEQCNSFSNFYLASLGQVSWNAVPAIPPELVLLPQWFYFHLSKVSAWTRTMILPLSILTTRRPVRTLLPEQGISELYRDQRERNRLSSTVEAPVFWRIFFHGLDRILKWLHPLGGTPFRGTALRRVVKWMLHRSSQDGHAATDGLGAIFPPMVYLQIALNAMGWNRSDPVLQRAERDLDALFLEQTAADGTACIKIQPCFSPVWDTGIALYALTECGLDQHDPSVKAASEWLRGKECRFKGDWADNVAAHEDMGGWYFEYNNAFYPDVDDTAMVAMALHRSGGAANVAAGHRGVRWLMSMQNDDGGWAAFDRTRHRQILEYIPFADHNAMQDPSCSDITGRILECLSRYGYTTKDATVRRAIDYVRRTQCSDGSWIGRWGVNYIYGTWQALVGPINCGVDRNAEWVQRAGAWVRSVQQQDGSFGESPNSYLDERTKGQGPSTASQTAWAVMTMQAIYGPDDEGVQRAVDWLVSTQLSESEAADPLVNPDNDLAGSWSEPWYTGTGFPKVFYLRYHLYRLYFPIMAVARWNTAMASGGVLMEPVARIEPKVHFDVPSGI